MSQQNLILSHARIGFLLVFFLHFAPCGVRAVQADDLREVLEGVQVFDRGATDTEDARWFTKRPAYKAIFTGSRDAAGEQLHQWLGNITIGYTPGKVTVRRTTDYLSAIRPYTDYLGSSMEVNVLVPHPRAETTIELGLVPAFAELEPPKLQTTSAEDVMAAGHPGKLYILEQGGAELLIKLPGKVWIVVSGKPKSPEALLDLAKKMDIERLERKLGGE